MRRATTWLILLLLVGVVVSVSLQLAGIRIYQVDECQNVYTARILSTGQTSTAFSSVSPFLLLLSWITSGAGQAVDLFVRARFLMLEIFWLNLLLIALATGEKLISARGIIALAGAATLAPVWDYGFEVRHDNVLLTGILLGWCAVRVRPAGLQSYAITGAIAVVLQFISFKAFVYMVPLSLAIVAFPAPGFKYPRWKLAVAWAFGALVVFLIIRIVYQASGLWSLYLSDLHRVAGDASGNNRFAPWQTLARLLTQTPLLLALILSSLAAVALDARQRGIAGLSWESSLPEALLFLVATAALLLNPTPFPYNLLLLVPFAYLLVFKNGVSLWSHVSGSPRLIITCIGILLFSHIVPFAIATHRHFDRTNFRQERLMRLAEDLTDPVKDPVYDGIGIVPTRARVNYWWYLHSFIVDRFTKGSGPRVHDMLSANPAAVIIPNYRTDWLTDADHDFIRARYVPLADDFCVLGKELSNGGGTFEVVHPGRYRISTLSGSDLADTYELGIKGAMTPEEPGTLTFKLDGAPMTNGPVQLSVGTHRIECAPDCEPAVVWLGPHLDRIHRIGPGNHDLLFFNWY